MPHLSDSISSKNRPAVLLERHRKIDTLQQWLIFEGTKDNSFLKLLTLKKGIKLLSRSLPLFDKASIFNLHTFQGIKNSYLVDHFTIYQKVLTTSLLISESVKYFATACGSARSSPYKERNSARVGERSRSTNSTVPQSM